MIGKLINLILALGLIMGSEVIANDDAMNIPYQDVQGKIKESSPIKPTQQKGLTDKSLDNRDPFVPTHEILTSVSNDGGLRVTPLLDDAPIPKMRMKGLIQQKNSEIVALLDIDGSGVYMVHVGDIIGLYKGGYKTVIKILQINRLDVIVEAGSLGQQIIVR